MTTTKLFALGVLLLAQSWVSAQAYTSYFTGNTENLDVEPAAGTVLMGGATEDDNAMIWFLEKANGGDVLVLRASGSDGYNDYLYSDLGVNVNSVETIVFNNASAVDAPYILDRINNAEAIWLAGGDQWNYISYWQNSQVQSALQAFIEVKQGVIGGTSAGMAVLGGSYFSAQNGTVSSSAALNNPFNNNMTIGSNNFLEVPYLDQVITDTHYDDPDRRGRHIAFMARMIADGTTSDPRGIASEEYTAVCVEPNGIARVFGGYPAYEDYAYFVRLGCESETSPELVTTNQPLTWNRNQEALAVYKVPGTADGSNTLDLNNWLDGTGGTWERWYVEEGVLNVNSPAEAPSCTLGIGDIEPFRFLVYPNPVTDEIRFASATNFFFTVYDLMGKEITQGFTGENPVLSVSAWSNGVYLLQTEGQVQRIVVQH